MQQFVGIDLHKVFAFWTVKDETGGILSQEKIPVEETITRSRARMLCARAVTKAVIEPVCAWQLYTQWLEEEGIETKAVAPLKVKAMAWNRLKNDRVDSEILAELLRVGFVPEITFPTPFQSELSSLMMLRVFFIRKRARLKQKMREVLLRHNLIIKNSDIFGKKAQEELRGLSLPRASAQMKELIINIAQALTENTKRLDKYLEETYGSKEGTSLLRSIPGIGLITALTMQAVVGDWTRFRTPAHLASFAGMVPSSSDSGGNIRRGHITKRGSRILRAALYEATVGVKPSWGHLWYFFERVKAKKGIRCARVALSRKMLTIAWYLMRKKEMFSPQKVLNQNRPDLVFELAPYSKEAVRIE